MKKFTQQEVVAELKVIVIQLLAESGVRHAREIKLEDSLQRHLGIDSLGRAELFRRVEKRFDITMPDRMLAEAESLGDVAAYLNEIKPTYKPPISSQHRVITHGEVATVDPSSVRSLVDLLLLYGEKSPNKVHVYFQNENGEEETLTYGQLLQSSRRVAFSLRQLGLKEGETVAIMQPTTLGFFYTFFGTLLAGGIPVPIYPPFRAHMIEAYAKTEARILNSAQVRILVTFDRAESLSRMLQAFVPSLKVVTMVDDLLKEDFLQAVPPAKPDQFAFIQYTSGSTSDPKGVLLTHHNLLSNIRAYGKAINVSSNDVTISWLPLYHDFGLIGSWLGSLYHGIPLILMTPFAFLNHPERWLWAVHYHRGTISGAPNFAYELCVNKIEPERLEGLDLSSWRVAANGAEKVYPRTLELFAKKFAPYGFKREALMPVYGLAESTVGLTIPPLGREFRIDSVDRKAFEEERRAVPTEQKAALQFVGCGMPIEGHEVRVVNNEGVVLPEREIGNLHFRGPSNMQGYFNNPVATRAIYYDGWLDSGDLAYIADREVFITGRRKDLIIKAGRNLYPVEIEELVGSVSGIRIGCVAAFEVTNDERGTEQLIIVAETRESDKNKRDRMIVDINDIVASTLDISPDHVVLVGPHTVPKTSSGKLQRAACKSMYLQGRLSGWRMPAWMQIGKLGLKWFSRKAADAFYIAGRLVYTTYVIFLAILTIIPMYVFARFASSKALAWVCKRWMRLGLRVAFCPLTLNGAENLTKQRPVIYAVNHASYVDAVVLIALLPSNTLFVGKKELFSAPFIRTFMRKLGHISIDRWDLPKGLQDAKHIGEALMAGHSIAIFPEGTFSYAAGLRPFRLGAFKTAAEAHVPICPIAISGTRKILRDGEILMRPEHIRVTVCAPIMPKGDEWHDVTSLRDETRAEIAKYCDEPSLDFIAAQTIAIKKSS